MKRVFNVILCCIAIIVICLISVIFLTFQSTPQMINKHTVDVDAASNSKAAAKRLVDSLRSKNQPVVVSLSQSEINGLSALAHRAIPRIMFDVVIHNKVAKLDAVIELPLPKYFRYINFSGWLYPHQKRLMLGDITVGSITLSGTKFISLGKWFINVFVQEGLGTDLSKMVKWVTLDNNTLEASVYIPQDLKKIKDKESGLVALRENLAMFGGKINNPESVKFYYSAFVNKIDALDLSIKKKQSIAYYIDVMFSLVEQQRKSNQYKKLVATEENSAALMALGVYFGSNAFELMVGDISNLTQVQESDRKVLQRYVTLNNRSDLQQHFIYSVAIQLLSNTTTSDTIGEIKEFLDSNGGSGFSFADLTADRAGTRLAQLATSNEKDAVKVQSILSNNIQEGDFMPDITNIAEMPEGITAEVFKKEYRDVDSTEYKNKLRLIDGKLAKLALYQ